MSTQNKPWDIIKELASDNSKLFKEAVIKREAASDNIEFFSGLMKALHPNITFGIKKLTDKPTDSLVNPRLDSGHVDLILNDLITRKLSGDIARESAESIKTNATSSEWNYWYKRIIMRDLAAGFSESTVNKACKEYPQFKIPTTPYQRCSLPDGSNMSKWNWSDGIFVQEKADGSFSAINVYDDEVRIFTRNGTIYPDGILGIEPYVLQHFPSGSQTHGELVVYQDNKLLPREKGNGVLNSLAKGGTLEENQYVKFLCWDQIPISEAVEKGQYKVPYEKRYGLLFSQMGSSTSRIEMIDTKRVYSQAEAFTFYRSKLAAGLEGAICKHPNAIWKDGTSKDQVKMKLEIGVELRVKALRAGKDTGKNADTFGSLECISECGKLEVNVTGLSDELRMKIFNNFDQMWKDSIITVTSNSIMYPSSEGGKYSLFLPRFTEKRDDKETADTLEEIIAQFTNAIK